MGFTVVSYTHNKATIDNLKQYIKNRSSIILNSKLVSVNVLLYNTIKINDNSSA